MTTPADPPGCSAIDLEYLPLGTPLPDDTEMSRAEGSRLIVSRTSRRCQVPGQVVRIGCEHEHTEDNELCDSHLAEAMRSFNGRVAWCHKCGHRCRVLVVTAPPQDARAPREDMSWDWADES